ncbi:hypothetical protein IGJ04_003006 [Enterococcus sp. AZ050]
MTKNRMYWLVIKNFFLGVFILFILGGMTTSAQELDYKNTLPYYGYNENSENNGQGYLRKTVAVLGVGNISDNTAISSGNQSQNGSSISGGWKVGPNDKVVMDLHVEGMLLKKEINRVNFEFYYNDVIEIDTTIAPQVVLPDGKSQPLTWGKDVIYSPENKKITASLTPDQLLMPDNNYSPAIRIQGQIKEFSIGDYSQIPLNLRITTQAADGNTYVSGVTGYFSSKNQLTAQKTVKNLSDTSSDKFYEGDTIEYVSELNNTVAKPTVDVKNITVEDELPTGFEYDPDSLVISKVGVTGEEIITNQVTMHENSTKKISFTLNSLEANMKLIVKYQGKISTGITELTNTVKFIGSQQNVANNPMIVTNTIQVNKDLSSIEVKDSSIFVGDPWKKEDNFVSATDRSGTPLTVDQIQVIGNVDNQRPGKYPITYKNGSIEKIATVTVKGKLELNVPSTFDFGIHELEKGTSYYEPRFSENEEFTVIDRRGKGSKWQLTAKMNSVLTNNEGKELPNSLIYKTESDEQIITQNSAQLIASKTTTESEDSTDITVNWNAQKGILLKIKTGEASIGEYTGTIEWTLNDTP